MKIVFDEMPSYDTLPVYDCNSSQAMFLNEKLQPKAFRPHQQRIVLPRIEVVIQDSYFDFYEIQLARNKGLWAATNQVKRKYTSALADRFQKEYRMKAAIVALYSSFGTISDFHLGSSFVIRFAMAAFAEEDSV